MDAEEVKSATHTWDTLKIDKLFPQVCFSTKEEYLECQEEFGTCMIICSYVTVVDLSKGWAWGHTVSGEFSKRSIFSLSSHGTDESG